MLGVKPDDDLFFICRSGGRSLAAAKAMAVCLSQRRRGFEGPLDDKRHRGTAGGWKAVGFRGCRARGGWPLPKEPTSIFEALAPHDQDAD
jgi:hypothetical protein